MRKRQDSKFTNEEIFKVYQNWEKIAKEYKVILRTKKTSLSTQSILAKAVKYKEKDELYWNTYTFELTIPYKSSQIHIKSPETKYPHLSFKLTKPTNFEFYLWKEDFMDKLSKWMGTKELQTGHKAFDSEYFIKTTDEEKIKTVLNSKTKQFLLDTKITVFKLENSTLEIGAFFNELNTSSIKAFIEASKYIIDHV